jgi:hypothetical protein
MSERKEKKTLLYMGPVLAVLVVFLLWGLLGREDIQTEVHFSGPSLFPVTPDSAEADPLQAPSPSFAAFSLTFQPHAALLAGGRVKIEQGYLFKGRLILGEDVRYAFPNPVIDRGDAPNYLSVHTKVTHELALVPAGLGRYSPEVTLPKGLPKGEEVVFHFGDPSQGSPGMAVPTHPIKIKLLTLVDRTGEGSYELALGEPPQVEACAHNADRFQVYGPSITYKAAIRLKIVPLRGVSSLDSSALPVRDYAGTVRLYLLEKNQPCLGQVRFSKGDRFKEVELHLPSPGLYRIEARGEKSNLSGESNPMLFLKEDGPSFPLSYLEGRVIYWGSLQNHTSLGGHAASLPAEAFRCAREEGGLDFCALTDHSSNPSFHWGELRGLPDQHQIPGRFVTFAGYEWTSGTFGHRHIILKEGQDTIACSERPTDDPFEVYAPDLHALAARVGSDPNALLVVHHTRRMLDHSQTRYRFGDASALPRQRLFEVFSWQGSSEGAGEDLWINGREDRTLKSGSGLRDALQMGYPFGVTADSDGHLGLPGVAVGIRRKAGLRYGFSGQTAVICRALSRENLFHALEERHCYGTTGARILLLFKAGEYEMGEVFVGEKDVIRIQVLACGTTAITSLKVIADGNRIAHEAFPNQRDAKLDLLLPLEKGEKNKSLYVRLEQADGHRAWSSPVWIKN